jgi:hypothetical protein
LPSRIPSQTGCKRQAAAWVSKALKRATSRPKTDRDTLAVIFFLTGTQVRFGCFVPVPHGQGIEAACLKPA